MARALAALLLAGLLAAAGGAATPRRGGTLVASRPALSCLNPFAPCNIPPGDPVLTQVLEGAFEVGPDLVFRQNLVSRATIERNPFRVTYRIRPEARWNDGTPVSSADFEFTYRTFAAHMTFFVDLRDEYAKIRRLRILGPKRFRVEFREPHVDWRSLFYLVLPRHALAGEDVTAVWRDRIDNPKTGRPIGNGPFLVSRLEAGRQLTLVRNRSYWGPHTAYLDRFVFRFGGFDQADWQGPLRRNEIHFAYGPPGSPNLTLDAEQAAQVAQIPGWRAVAWPGLAKELLVFRLGPGGHPALRNRLVRRALAYGIDRIAIARRVNPELGRRARPLDSTVLLADERFHRPNWRGYRYDPARARRLLGQAGCRRGADGIYSCGGQRLRLRFFTSAGIAWREHAIRLAQGQLRRAGIDVQPTFVPPTALRAILGGGDFDAFLFSWTGPPGGSETPEARCGDEANSTGYCSRAVDRDVRRADGITDPARRARLLNAADAGLARDVPVLPLFQRAVRAARRDTVRGFVPGGVHFHFFENSEDWWLAR